MIALPWTVARLLREARAAGFRVTEAEPADASPWCLIEHADDARAVYWNGADLGANTGSGWPTAILCGRRATVREAAVFLGLLR